MIGDQTATKISYNDGNTYSHRKKKRLSRVVIIRSQLKTFLNKLDTISKSF